MSGKDFHKVSATILCMVIVLVTVSACTAAQLSSEPTPSATPETTSNAATASPTPRPSETFSPTEDPAEATEESTETIGDGPSPVPVITQLASDSAAMTATSAFEMQSVQSSATAAVFDAQATVDAMTATQLAAASTPIPMTEVASLFTMVDAAGRSIGGGQVRVYAPRTMNVNEASEIRVEIQVDTPIGAGEAVLNPAPSPTPVLDTPLPLPTPLPALPRQFVEVREYMGVQLRGVDAPHFTINAVPPDGIRHMQANQIVWWKWSIRPVGEEAVGSNLLEVEVYLPQQDGSIYQITNIVPVTIEVIGSAAYFFDTTMGRVSAVLGFILAIGGVIGMFYQVGQWMKKRSKPA